MDTATLTLANDDTVLLPAVHMAGRHRRPSLLARVRYYTAPEPVVTVVILLAVVLMAAGVVAAAVWPAPVSAGATWDPQPAAVAPVAHTAPACHEDQPCWDSRWMGNQQAGIGAAHGPVMDDGGVYGCEPGGDLVFDNGYGATVCDYSRRFV